MGQCDSEGNINVSRFGGRRLAGCGGFINISQNAKIVVFLGTFTVQGLEIQVRNGELKIIKEGTQKKFLKKVDQITFSAELAKKDKRVVRYTSV